jgi:oligopeptide transport system ATP-binding protein
MASENGTLLSVKNLRTSFFTPVGVVQAVRNVNIELKTGQTMGLVGESGCGKSVMALSILRLVPNPGKITEGEILFNGENLLEKSEREMRTIRGNIISMIFQDPMTSLNPTLTIGNQIVESLRLHQRITNGQAWAKAVELLDLVGIPSPRDRVRQFPFEFSGGMRQRAMIAMALSCNPALLIADEPTTALDVTIQAQILELMKELRSKINSSVILITHDLGVVADFCDIIKVMYAGIIVEEGEKRDIFYNAYHPYTLGLLNSVPKMSRTNVRQRLVPIDGQPPDLLLPPKGCPFADRCQYAMRICRDECPELASMGGGHKAACWLTLPEAPKPAGYREGARR